MSSRCRAAQRELTAAGIYTHARIGTAEFHLGTDDVGDVGVKVFEETGAVVVEAEAEAAGSSSTGVCLELTAEEATELASQLTEAAEESRGTDQEGA